MAWGAGRAETMDTSSRTITYYPGPEEFMWMRTSLGQSTTKSRSVHVTPKSVMYSKVGSNLPFNLGPRIDNFHIEAIHGSIISSQECSIDLVKSFPEFF